MTAVKAHGIGSGLLVATGVAVAATIAAALMVMGAPDTQRQVRLDERRVQELQRLSEAVETHAYRHGALPQALSEITGRPGMAYATTDPVTGVPYRYERVGPDDYRLCTAFDTDTSRAGPAHGPMAAIRGRIRPASTASTARWTSGRACASDCRSRDAPVAKF